MATVEAASSKGNRPRGTIPLPAATPDTPQDRASQAAKGLKGLKKLVEPLEPLTPRRRRSTRAKNRRKVLRAKSRRKLLPLNEVSDETIQWLFPNLIPLGNITILDGAKAEGKSTLTYDPAARITSGSPMPFCDGHSIAGGVILLQAEDDLGATVEKSVVAAGGMPDKIRVFSKQDTLYLDDPGDLELVRQAAKEINAKLLVVDPCTEFFLKNLKDERTIRKSFHLLRELAASLKMAIILVRHFAKTGANALYRGLGGVAVMNAARAALVVGHDPSSDDLVAATQNADGHSQLQEACHVLYSILTDAGTPVPATAVNGAAKEALVSISTLKRAKKLLKVRSAPQVVRHPGAREQRQDRTEDRDRLDVGTAQGR